VDESRKRVIGISRVVVTAWSQSDNARYGISCIANVLIAVVLPTDSARSVTP